MDLQTRPRVLRDRLLIQVHVRQVNRSDLDRVGTRQDALFDFNDHGLTRRHVEVAQVLDRVAAHVELAQQRRHRQRRWRVVGRSGDAETIAPRRRRAELVQGAGRIRAIPKENDPVVLLPDAGDKPGRQRIVQIVPFLLARQLVNRRHGGIEHGIGRFQVTLDLHRRNV